MQQFVPIEKSSKKAQREFYAKHRSTWSLNPVTRRPPDPKAYNRKKIRRSDDFPDGSFYFAVFSYTGNPYKCFSGSKNKGISGG